MCMCGDSECPSCGVAQGTKAMTPEEKKAFIAYMVDGIGPDPDIERRRKEKALRDAAPLLLEALKRIVDVFPSGYVEPNILKARKIIARAEGRS